jgi:hypothetical protein
MNRLHIFFLIALSMLVYNCQDDTSSAEVAVSSTGVGGSLARFTILGNHLYTIDNTTLTTFSLENPAQPEPISAIPVGEGVETIFPLGSYLFMGTQNGMLIYSVVSNDGTPVYVSSYQHVVSCDPVVANAQYAYVTLRVSGCRQAAAGAADLLEVIDISNISNPQVVGSYDMKAPRGLGLDGEVLFVCQGSDGIKVFSTADPLNLVEIGHLEDVHANDVIMLDGLMIAVGPTKLVQLDYSDLNDIKVVSEIEVGV